MKKKTHTYCPLFKVIDWINQSLSSSPICEKKRKSLQIERESRTDRKIRYAYEDSKTIAFH